MSVLEVGDRPECWPALPLDSWKDTYATFHMCLSRRFDSCRLLGSDRSSVGTWQDRVPHVSAHLWQNAEPIGQSCNAC